MKIKTIFKKNKKGFTLTEILLVLVIASVLIIGVFFMYKKVSLESRTGELVKSIQLFQNKYDEIYNISKSTSITNDLVGKMLSLKIVPPPTPGGPSRVYIDEGVEINFTNVGISIRYLPRDLCLRLAMKMRFSFTVYNWDGSSVLVDKDNINQDALIKNCDVSTAVTSFSFKKYP